MDSVFVASRLVGQAWAYSKLSKSKEARDLLKQSSDHFVNVKIPRDLATNWPEYWGGIGTRFDQIHHYLRDKNDMKAWHSASAGWSFGLAAQCSLLISNDDKDNLSEAKRQIDMWLIQARDHTAELRSGEFVNNMPDFSLDFSNCLSCFRVIDAEQWGHFPNCGSQVKILSDKVGNAIR